MPRSLSKREKAKRQKRLGESQEETDARNSAQKKRRQEASPESTQRRQANERARQEDYRERERSQGKKRADRQLHDSQQHALARLNEPDDHRAERQLHDSQQHAIARHNARIRVRNGLRNIAFNFDPIQDYPDVSSIGRLSERCVHCAAMKFPKETKGVCCGSGKVVTEAFPALPQQTPFVSLGNFIAAQWTHRSLNLPMLLTSG